MSEIVLKETLKEHRLRNTQCRTDILAIFIEHDFALSHADIEDRVSEHYDRVTVYRTLKTFVDKGLIHKVLDDNGAQKYALCNADCSEDLHKHEHVHFKCIRCGLTTCLDESDIPGIKLPAGYVLMDVSMLVTGYCKDCQQ
ncbi:MAG: transcriptional repressor [Imperialibacter sp.]|uniref:Fur family transcriptional regulator n=1 Tax=Imperialibacter sp. TaxID=2038411 RepID=UPI0032EEDBA0